MGLSINEVRDMILFENKLERRSMTPTDYGLLMEKAAVRTEQERADTKTVSDRKPSIRGQLAAAKAAQAEQPAAHQHHKDKGAR